MASSMQAAFDAWKTDAGAAAAVQFAGEDEGVATLAFGAGSPATVTVMPVMDGAQISGFFVEAIDDDVPDRIEDWVTAVNTLVGDASKLTFADVLSELVRLAPAQLRVKGAGAAAATPQSQAAAAAAGEDADLDDDDADCEDLAVDETYDDYGDICPDVEEDELAREARRAKFAAEQEDRRQEEALLSAPSSVSRQAQQVLMREMKSLMKLQGEGSISALQIEMVDDRIDRWLAKMPAESFPDCPLRSDLFHFATKFKKEAAIVFDVRFPQDFPQSPPFVRLLRPRFQMHSGHVTIGGSVCMQALTPSGWLPSFSLENVFVEIRSQMIEGGGRLDPAGANRDYTEMEAREAFNRVASRYGWLK
eukprot:TRINITY_DN15599_c0_g1_i1.p1 TRINITY_DN15599_c0_g1~~TRINITY_DN15599_c0_g1_i1.p1  ORF type:complete len:394 (+),score=81.13 TRINITY_DN15599_c0_g1_i1:95-1183(+)